LFSRQASSTTPAPLHRYLSAAGFKTNKNAKNNQKNGTPDKIRTYDLWLRKPTLYPAELRVHTLSIIAITLYKINITA
jgi:hypothetical protein